MPYSASDVSGLPANIRSLPSKRRRMWVHVWNSAYHQCQQGADPSSGDCESFAFRNANGVIKTKGKAEHAMTVADTESTEEFLTFKKLSAEERQNLPSSAYAYTDPQGGKHLPVHDIAHLQNAISRLGQKKTLREFMGKKAKAALQAKLQARLARAKHSYDELFAHDLAMFDLGPDKDDSTLIEAAPDSDVIVRRGRIFRSGDYPDKDFSLTPKELKRVARNFAGPVAIDSEHERSIFDGKLGQLVSIEASKDGTELHGLVAIPKWLDPILMAAGGKVSAAFDRATKKLVGLALTINPRVSDAALMAAFSVDQVTHGAVSVQELIAMAEKDDKKKAKADLKSQQENTQAEEDDDDDDDDDAEVQNTQKDNKKKQGKFVGYDGMVPAAGKLGQSGGAKSVKMAKTNSGLGMMQTIHDVTASRGAVCRVEPQPATEVGPYGIVRYASKSEMDVVQSIHDTTLQNGASCTPTLYGQRDVPSGLPWTWEWPGIKDEGRSGMRSDVKAPHFNEEDEEDDDEQGSQKTMKAFAKFMDSLDTIDPRYGSTPNRPKAAAESASNDDNRRLDEENARLREENRQMRMQGILDRAISFADKVIIEGHATPIEREGIVTVHAQLEHDDTFTAKATFSNGMSRVAAYEASILARPNNLLASELLPSAVQAGLIKFANMSDTPKTTNSDGGKPSQERKQFLANLDPVLKKASEATYKNGTSK